MKSDPLAFREIEFLDPNGIWHNFADPVEVWMSAGGPKGLAIAAKHADYMTRVAWRPDYSDLHANSHPGRSHRRRTSPRTPIAS